MLSQNDLTAIMRQFPAAADGQALSCEQFRHEEGEDFYTVWKVTVDKTEYVLKEAKGTEREAYQVFAGRGQSYAPGFFGTVSFQDKDYILMEYVPGDNLQKCGRDSLRTALDSLIAMQEEYWENSALADCCYSFEKSLKGRNDRGNYLNDMMLEQVYREFLHLYSSVPRTLCHDDLLPFNVIRSGERAVLIDWEVCGILPYPVSLARLIAHGTEDDNALFCMKQEDREFAIRYYYDHLIDSKGISYEEYRRTMDYFLFYEYCEWVFVGNKYGNTDSEYYKEYSILARQAALRLLQADGSPYSADKAGQ